MIEVRGRVVGPDGKPVPGRPCGRRTSIRMEVARGNQRAGGPVPHAKSRDRSGTLSHAQRLRRVPLDRRHGPGIRSRLGRSAFKAAASGELTVRLVEDGPPIEGRIVDLEGRPVAGAQVKAGALSFSGDGDLTPWLDAGQGPRESGPWGRPRPVAAEDRHARDRRRRPVPTGRDRPRADRRALHLGPDDRHDRGLCHEPRRGGGPD